MGRIVAVEVLCNLGANREIEAPAKRPILSQVRPHELVGRKLKQRRIYITSIHTDHIGDSMLDCSMQPCPLSASDIKDAF